MIKRVDLPLVDSVCGSGCCSDISSKRIGKVVVPHRNIDHFESDEGVSNESVGILDEESDT